MANIKAYASNAKNQMVEKMMQAPIEFPYVNWDTVNKFSKVSDRYRISTSILDDKTAAEYALPVDHEPEILLARARASKYVDAKLRSGYAALIEVAAICKISPAAVTHFSSRLLALPNESLVPLCYLVLEESCHKVLFGEEKEMHLTGLFAEAMRQFESLPARDQNKINLFVQDVYEEYQKNNPVQYGSVYRRKPSDVTKDRLIEMSNSTLGGSPFAILQRNSGTMLMRYLYGAYEPCEAANSINFYMFLCNELHVPFDYLVAEEYPKYTKCFYTSQKGRRKPIKEPISIDFLTAISAVDNKTRASMLAPLFATTISKVS